MSLAHSHSPSLIHTLRQPLLHIDEIAIAVYNVSMMCIDQWQSCASIVSFLSAPYAVRTLMMKNEKKEKSSKNLRMLIARPNQHHLHINACIEYSMYMKMFGGIARTQANHFLLLYFTQTTY